MKTNQLIGETNKIEQNQYNEQEKVNEESNKIKVLKYLILWKRKNQDKKFPSFNEISAGTGIKLTLITSVLFELEKDPLIKKYGELKRNYSQYSFQLPISKKEEAKKIIKKVSEVVWSKYIVFKLFIFFISIIGLFMALYYNSFSFDDVRRTPWTWLSSLFFVTSAIIFFEAVILFFQMGLKKNKGYYALSFLFFLLWLIIISFNMVNIMAGQRNSYVNTLVEKTQLDEITVNNVIYMNLKDDIVNLKKEISIIEEERKKWIDKKEDTWRKQIEIQKYEKRLDMLNKQLAEKKNDQNKMLTNVRINSKVNSEEFFTDYIARILHFKAEKIQIILYLFRAILLDLITSIGFALILFLEMK